MDGEQKNVLGGRLQTCSREPWTGFMRTGCCHTGASNPDGHTVCARVTQEFLDHELKLDNDLVTPDANMGFAGLKPGDRWCVCADVWLKAHDDGVAPPVCLEATNEKALEVVPLERLREQALPPEEPWPEDRAADARLTAGAERSPGAATAVTVRVAVSDMGAALDFYVETLGFEKTWDWGDPVTVVGLRFGSLSLQLELCPEMAGRDCNHGIRVMVDDVDALYAEHLRRGARPEHPPVDRPWCLREYAVVDPDGYHLCFSQDVDDAQALNTEG